MSSKDLTPRRETRWISTTRWALLTLALALLVVVVAFEPSLPQTNQRASHLQAQPNSHPTTTMHQISTALSPTPKISPNASSDGSITGTKREVSTGTPAASNPGSSSSSSPDTTPQVIPLVSATPLASEVKQGWLEGPTQVSATYLFSASPARSVVSSWSGASTLTISLLCDGVMSSRSGTSGISLWANGTSCSVSISGPSDVPLTTFTITLGAH